MAVWKVELCQPKISLKFPKIGQEEQKYIVAIITDPQQVLM